MGAGVGTAIFFVGLVTFAFIVEVAMGIGYIRALNDKMEGKWQ